ncbi:MAG: hypothetical protein HN894_13460, partial [Bacteroidetes bacterium]|nr:hypothetical protein [Bacteroidota bacterium]
WTTTGNIDYVEIWYTTDYGNIWNYIDDHAYNDGQFEWTVPNISTSMAQIKINMFGDPTVADVSNTAFTINPVSNSVTIISPNGGEVLTAGTVDTIQWSWTGTFTYGAVEIWYSTDGGNIWNMIDDYAQNSGQYAWTVPNVASTNTLIQINEVYNSTVVDVSDNAFEIAAPLPNTISIITPNGGETLTGGRNYNISWTTTGSIDYVEIWYTTDYGNIWNYIDDHAYNDGQFEWTVPNISTSMAQIKINMFGNTSVVDYSNTAFTINPVSNSVTVTSPNGGEVLTAGTADTIQWSWTGTFTYGAVEIWYSSDGGNIWNYIDDYALNNGQYVWTVPNIPTTNALIKINEVYNSTVVDVSDNMFEIAVAVSNPVTVTAPNGGETLTGGSTFDISWTSDGSITWLDLYYSTDGGNNWVFIADHETNDGSFSWTVPNVTTYNAKIMITEFSNSNVYDMTDGQFIINAVTNSVTVISPNGGEVLTAGSVDTIQWSWTGIFTYGAVEIWYSTDGGNIWNMIDDYAQNSGQYVWTVPNVATTNALIQINEVYNSTVVDVSDNVFEITAAPTNSITIISPNGGEILSGGSTYNITWNSTGSFDYLEIWYTTDNGNIWNYIDDHAYNDGQFEWTVPNCSTSMAKIKINEFGNSSVVDVSNSLFTITPTPNSITITSPNGGETWAAGSVQNIQWSWTGTFIYGAVEIWYSTDGGNIWNMIDDYAQNSGQYVWTVPNVASTNALIQINEVYNSTVVDVSDNVFEISTTIPNTISIITPNGGETLTGGSNYNIIWTTTGNIDYVEIWYTTDYGNIWNYIDDHAYNDGQFEWTVPNISTSMAQIKINMFGDATVADVSNSAFTINPVSNSITVISPNGGEILTAGSIDTIQWSWTGTFTYGAVEIYYSTDGGNIWNMIDDYAQNSGQYVWTVPNVASTNALIQINEVYNSTVVDVSDNVFEISTTIPNTISIITPNGGETLTGGSNYNIIWTTTGNIDYVEIWYTTDYGNIWNYIDDHAYNDGQFEWTVPNISTSMAQIKINMFGDPTVADVSNTAFTINPVSNSITVISPNGGEVWNVGTTHDISWTTTGAISYVEIWYSADNAINWNYIDDYSINDGLYEWTVPNNITTTALVKINEVFNSSVVDESDTTFEIAASSPFTVITPNGGEVLTGGSTYTITWSTSGYSGNYVGILYSTDGGATWGTVDDFHFNNGFKEWTVANVATTNALIKVHEVFNPANGDVSDAPFTIDAIPNSITVTSPNGGEVISGNSTYNITWTSTGLINNVEIWYSSDGGQVWNYIDDYSSNDGLYEWDVPNNSTANALVKINEVYNNLVMDMSDNTFEIVEVIPITITTPNGGEILTGGSTYNITWISDGSFSYVDLYYSTDGGSNWDMIADHEENDSIYTWNVPNIATTDAMIAITEYNNTNIYDFSNAPFTINAVTNTVTVIAPNGGEVWTAGSVQNITWTSIGTISFVEIWYSSDGGQVWNYIDDYSQNDGLYGWTVPNVTTVNALVKINEVYNTAVVDVSDASFEINLAVSNPVTIDSPNGGEILTGGSSYDIIWTSDQSITWLDLYYSTDGGMNWNLIADHETNDSSYAWNVPNISTTNTLVKITEFGNSSIYDESDAVFTINAIPNTITVLSPNGGESWAAGSAQYISWTTSGSISYVEIWYSTDNGSNWNYIDDYSPNDGVYEWTVPAIATTEALIKINEVFNSSVVDVSDTTFEITVVAPNSITVLAPNGGEVLVENSNYNISWSTTGQFDYVEIWYSADAGNTWNYIDDHSLNDGIFEWIVPNISTANALIKINEFGNSSVVDISDANFEISTAINSLTLTHPNGGELLTISATYYVVWESIGNISNVDLSYSTDSGATWDSIASNVPNNGLYSWEIPNTPSSNALVKVLETGDPAVADISDSTFTITSTFYSSLMVLAPNGGEVITGGSSYEITWSSVGMIPYVALFYSIDNGINWIVIDTYLGSNGPYSWNVPNINSQNVLVRIENQFDPSMGDNSNNVFSISSPLGNSLTVTQPDGGEILTTGSSVDITWTSTGSISNVDILYSIDGGSNWSVITNNTINDGIYTWQVPNDTSSTALISIRDAGNVNTSDESNSTFTITQTGPSITITSPNGGEVWPGGSSHNITWTSTGSITHVQVAYSLNGGQTWIYLSVYGANSGTLSWTVPYVNSTSALVKVNDVFNQNTTDISDNSFVIGSLPAQITILSPNGGETWAGGSTQNISWTSTGAIPYVEIWYSPDGGQTWTYLDDYAVNDGLFEWTVPYVYTTTAVVKINDVTYPYVVDYSDGPFTITSVPAEITILSPNGGEVWAPGTIQDITWSSTGNINYVEIWYSIDGGVNWSYIDDYALNDGLYEWTVPNVSTVNARVKINDVLDISVWDVSSYDFEISTVTTLTVLSPNGGEVLNVGSNYNITWSSYGSVNNVDIYYSTDAGVNITQVALGVANTGSYSWQVPNTPTLDGIIVIASSTNSNIWDYSNSPFTIGAVAESITVNSPNGNEVWTSGTTQNITWSSTGTISYVEIWYSTDGGQVWTYIDDYSSNDGLYEWTVPTVSTVNAWIKINDVANAATVDLSDAAFEITTTSPNTLTVVTPNGGEVWDGGTNADILWTSTGTIAEVDIYYSLDGGGNWSFVANNTPNDGTYTWLVSNLPTTNAIIAIIDSNNPNVSDVSDSSFTISAIAQTITVTSPNGGEVWSISSTQNITWSTTGQVNYVKIWYSIDGGSNWTNIAPYNPNTGSYAWTVPNAPSTNALIKIEDVNNASIVDVSDTTFEIGAALPNSITVVTPNGGEILPGGSYYDITWSSTGVINYVEIWYSTDGGTNWTYIDDYSANDGYYYWNVVNVNTSNALVKINDVSNSSIADVSDNAFTINAIANSLTVISPNGGEALANGNVYNITWSSTGSISYVEIWYSPDGGMSWNYIDDHAYNDGLFEWTVPNVTASFALIKINEFGNTSVMDISDSYFSINVVSNSITLISPNGGEVFNAGTVHIIQWSWTGTFTYGAVELWYSTDNGVNWNYINDYATNNGQYAWTVPNITTTTALIKINEVYNSSVVDISDNVFEIAAATQNSITVLTPNGGEVLTGGSNYDITWSSSGTINYVEIYYSTDGGSTWTYIDDYSPNDGIHTWNVENISTTNALIKIHEIFNSSVSDISDNTFTINGIPNTLTLTAPNGGEVWTVGSTQDISWSSTGSVNYIDVSLSTDGGINWFYIGEYLYNDGHFEWTVLNYPTTNAMLKINDVYNPTVMDVSDSNFEIAPYTTGITVLTPNGGESLIGGSTYDITWSSTVTIPYIEIAYSTDGITWTYVASFQANDGIYSWNVPNITSPTTYIKVFDQYSTAVTDMSDSSFSITPPASNAISVIYPNGGEVIGPGSIAYISWSSVGSVDYVDIYYSTDSAATWNLIAGNYYNYGSYNWVVPFVSSTNALIKIVDYADANIFDISDQVFEIDTTLATTITLITPNGGEVLTAGSTYNITWTTTGTMYNVMLHYSLDNGSTWILISDYELNNGLYSWLVPSVSSVTALVKITGIGGINDISDTAFEIAPPAPAGITINYPNGGEVITANDWSYISWTSSGIIGNVMIHYSIDNGTNWIMLNDNVQNSGGYQYIVPNVSSSQCLIKVQELGGSTVFDVSDSVFTIQPATPASISINYPNGGEVITANDWSYISWTSTGVSGNVMIHYSIDNGTNWIILNDNVQNSGGYQYIVPNVSSTQCLIKVQELGTGINDISDAVFAISEASNISILYPNGGEIIETNSNDSISWISTGFIDFVDIYYSHNAGSNWYLIEDSVANNGYFQWTPNMVSANYLIKIEELGNSSIFDISDQIFEVGSIAPIELLYPNGGEVFLGATLDSVLWNSNGNVNFNDIMFSSDGGTTWSWAGDAPAEWETVAWAIPNINSTTCLLAYGGDTSSSYFTIIENLNSITVLSPNGGEVYQGGDTLLVTWDTSECSTVPLIDFYYKLGYNFTLIANVPNTGSLKYLLPNEATTTAEVRLQLNGTAIYDDCDAPFTVTEIGITVLSPNGGETFTGNDSTLISWSQTGNFDGVELSYSPDNGSHWVIIEENVSGLSYQWTVPNIFTENCIIKVNRVDVTKDESNSVFTINNVPVLPWDSIHTLTTSYVQYHQWLSENIGFYNADQFPSGVYSSAFNTINKTIDGGLTWSLTNPIPSSYQSLPLTIFGAWFFDANNGLAIGHPPQWGTHNWNTYSTSDGGMSWTLVSDTIFSDFSTYDNFGLQDFEMLNANVGFANARTYNDLLGAMQDVVFLTADGGLTWDVQVTPGLTFLNSGEFVNESIGFVMDADNVYKTTDGGISWTVTLPVTGGGVSKSIDFVNDSVGYVVSRYNGSYFAIIRTTDQGLSWDQRNVPPISYIYVGEMDFFNMDMGLLSSTATGGASGIWRTSNGALTWETDSIVATLPLFKTDKASDIVMVNETINYAVLSGMIIKAGADNPPIQTNTWTFTNTGNSHTILIPNSTPVTIDGTQILVGDYLGVFYDSLGSQICAGFAEWTAQIQSITAWGDDLQTSQQDGFANGEVFQWKIWRATDGVEYNATATYIQPPAMPNTGTFVTNGISGLLSLEAANVDNQFINIPLGWSYFSTYIDPFEANLFDICAPFISDVVIIKDGLGSTFWPQYQINLIGDITIGEGYQIKLASANTMNVIGLSIQPENTPITVVQGWSFLGYLRENPGPIDLMLNTIVLEIIIVKNGLGQIYWPQWGINLIGNMVPGEGYQINMSTQQNLIYPANSIVFTKQEIYQPPSIHFKKAKNTGNNMSLGLITSNYDYGSEIGIFNQAGILVGSSVIKGEFTAITLWGDDEITQDIDGLQEGEKFVVLLWNGEERILEIDSWIEGDGNYEKNKISVADISLNNYFEISGYYLNQNAPNPFSNETEFSFFIPEKTMVEFSIYNVFGEKLAILRNNIHEAGKHTIQFDAEKLIAGTYYFRLKTEKISRTKMMIIIK